MYDHERRPPSFSEHAVRIVAVLILSALALVAIAFAGAAAQNTQTAIASVYAAQATAKTESPTSHIKGIAFDRFVIIWLENTDFSKAEGDPNLAWLASKGIKLSNYFAVTHPSEPNYVAAIGGDNFGMDNDAFNSIPANVSTVIDLLEDKGISWSEYQEDMPYSGFEGYAWREVSTGANDYVRKHNPAIIYNANIYPDRLAKIKNTTMFHEDLKNNELPQWMFITPNMTSDGHDTSVTTAGVWTRQFLEPLLEDKNFMQNTLVLVTFDENHTYTIGNRVFSILIGDAVPAEKVGSTDDSFYDHYSEIASVESNWNLNTLGRNDVGANVFGVVADKTREAIRSWDAVTGPNPTVFLNSSFAGPFNKIEYAPVYAPNVHAHYAGRRVSSKIVSQWAKDANDSFYTISVEIADGMHPPPGYNACNC